MIASERLGLAEEGFRRTMLKGGRGGQRGVYVSRATDIDWRNTVSVAEEKREKHYLM